HLVLPSFPTRRSSDLVAADNDIIPRLFAEVDFRTVDLQLRRTHGGNIFDVKNRQPFLVEAINRVHGDAVAVGELETLIDPGLREIGRATSELQSLAYL